MQEISLTNRTVELLPNGGDTAALTQRGPPRSAQPSPNALSGHRRCPIFEVDLLLTKPLVDYFCVKVFLKSVCIDFRF